MGPIIPFGVTPNVNAFSDASSFPGPGRAFYGQPCVIKDAKKPGVRRRPGNRITPKSSQPPPPLSQRFNFRGILINLWTLAFTLSSPFPRRRVTCCNTEWLSFYFLVWSPPPPKGESRKLQSAKNVVVEWGKFVVPCFLPSEGGGVISLNAISVDVYVARACNCLKARTLAFYWTTFGRAARKFFIALHRGPQVSQS